MYIRIVSQFCQAPKRTLHRVTEKQKKRNMVCKKNLREVRLQSTYFNEIIHEKERFFYLIKIFKPKSLNYSIKKHAVMQAIVIFQTLKSIAY